MSSKRCKQCKQNALRMQHSLKKNCIIRKENIILQNLFQHETQKISLEREKMIFARKKNDLLPIS